LKPKPSGPIIENAITKFIKSIDKCFFSSQRKSTFKEEFVAVAELEEIELLRR
jgi:hypothetical protein